MQALLTTFHVLGCLLLIGVVLIQSGRGGGVGAAFAGASGQLFGGRGASVFLTRLTATLAALFFLTSLGLSTLSSRQRSVLLRAPAVRPTSKADDAGDAQHQGPAADDVAAAGDQAQTPAAAEPAANTKRAPMPPQPGAAPPPADGGRAAPAPSTP